MKKFNRQFLKASSALRAVSIIGGATLAASLSSPIVAQDFTQVTATGRVLNDAGQPIPNATVVIRSDQQGFERTVTTSSNGTYRIPALPQGRYTFTVSAPEFAVYTESNIELNQANAANTFELVAAGSTATTQTTSEGNVIIVSGSRVRVSDFDRATVGAVVDVEPTAASILLSLFAPQPSPPLIKYEVTPLACCWCCCRR